MTSERGDAVRQAANGAGLARGVCRALHQLGYTSLTEFKLGCGRRVDVIGVDPGGLILIVEIKSSLEDFRADRKWREYLAYCDHFYFAVPEDFPREVLPEDCGLLVADPYGAAVLREAPPLRLNPTRRRAQILRFAHTAALRLARHTDPRPALA
ncbi:MAG: MmcB family DNA repair protein [Kiloniellaceae bacterium]